LDGSLLRSTYSKSVDGTYIERIYQNEFYHGAWMVMPARLSCDVGMYFGVKGKKILILLCGMSTKEDGGPTQRWGMFFSFSNQGLFTGAVDFYLNGQFQWAFELLRDGKRLREHSERFQPNKRYDQL